MQRLPKLRTFAAALLISGCLLLTTNANADLLFDRGLPTTNLNDAAGANRSNWSFGLDNDMAGDSFSLAAGGIYNINTIRVWQVWQAGDTDPARLWGGLATGTMSSIPVNSTSFSTVLYNGVTPFGDGTYTIRQYDFSVNWNVAGGQDYLFFVGSAGNVGPYMHISKSWLSGSTQDGADGWLIGYDPVADGAYLIDTSGELFDGSDMNVQLFGTQVPEPSTMLLLLPGLACLGLLRRRFLGQR